MEDFLFNTFLSLQPYIGVAVVLCLLPALAKPYIPVEHGQSLQRVTRMFRSAGLLCLLLGVVLSVASPTNTPKNTLDVNLRQENAYLARDIQKDPQGKMQNIAAQPKQTDDQREEVFRKSVDRSQFDGYSAAEKRTGEAQ